MKIVGTQVFGLFDPPCTLIIVYVYDLAVPGWVLCTHPLVENENPSLAGNPSIVEDLDLTKRSTIEGFQCTTYVPTNNVCFKINYISSSFIFKIPSVTISQYQLFLRSNPKTLTIRFYRRISQQKWVNSATMRDS